MRGRLSFAQVLGQSVSAVAPSAAMVTLPVLVLPAAGDVTCGARAGGGGDADRRRVLRRSVRHPDGRGQRPVQLHRQGPRADRRLRGRMVAADRLRRCRRWRACWAPAAYLTALLGRLGRARRARAIVAVLAVLVGVLALALMIRGVQWSARISLAVEVFAIVARRAVLTVFVHPCAHGCRRRPVSTAARSHILGGLRRCCWRSHRSSGSRAPSTVAREARNPFVTVPRAIRWTPDRARRAVRVRRGHAAARGRAVRAGSRCRSC